MADPYSGVHCIAENFMWSRAELFGAIVRLEVSFFDEAEVGVLTSRWLPQVSSHCY